MSSKDYYKTLDIDKSATKDDIKKAFRRMASKYHPDKKTGDEKKFKEISEAYAVLSDEKKKAEYDTYGQAFTGAGNTGGFGASGFNTQGFDFDLNDIFSNFGDVFGGGFGGGREQRGRDISIDIELSFKESVFGVKRKVLLTKNNICESCNGSGAKAGTELTKCSTCDGNGRVREARQSIMGNFTTVRACTVCKGSGEIPKEKCAHCAGTGVRRSQTEIEIAIPAGIQNGEMIRMPNQGEAITNGKAGDLYIKIHVKPHNTVTRNGFTLESELPIKLTDALLGETYTVATLDEDVKIKIPAGVRHGEKLRIKNKGVPDSDGRRGDFLVRISIATPTKLSKKAKKIVEDLREEGI